ncbi:sensor histidine kinase [Paenibacillus thermoaerophilus]|uniref:histidine kinase n=1 Tax=Paenibacillus thermoaerophilus TaxID=1215385 RepID=A0ABW2V0H4_9BACL|nr:sensor histidine kinase [Paenibacillus thermoaerophilus]TMV11025.1 sensor histidine kinase [Paenibacillus thermoaerophilus]
MKKTLFRQLFVYFLVVIAISLGAVLVFSYGSASGQLDRQTETYVAQVIENASKQTDMYLQTYERASISMLSNDAVKRFLDMDPADTYRYFELSQQIRRYAYEPVFILHPQIQLLYVLGFHGRAVVADNQNPGVLSRFDAQRQLERMRRIVPPDGSVAVLNGTLRDEPVSGVVTVARQIRGVSSYDTAGVLGIELKIDELERLWTPVNIGEGSSFLIYDSQGKLVYASNAELAGRVPEALRERLQGEGASSRVKRVGEREYLWVPRVSDFSGWTLVMALPYDELQRPVSTLRRTTMAVAVAALALALLLAYRFGRSLLKPIRQLRESMKETEKGNWQLIERVEREDEIGHLMRSYNRMVDRLSEMIARVYEAELENRNALLALQATRLERQQAEFQALQLQINPHFLYNTLETINCYAIVEENEHIAEVVEAMAFMLRYSIQTKLEEITVANELNHVRNFLIILKHRIGREFELDVTVPPSLLLAKMVRLTLQPIVENAFQHAFPDGLEPHHRIAVHAEMSEDRFTVMVEDNGAGMTPERLERIRERLASGRLADSQEDGVYHRGGIGLLNVHRRIQLVFGEGYGLEIDSELGRGTRIQMHMPFHVITRWGRSE